MINIFYSWQADIPNNINRSFIYDCLKQAKNELEKELGDFNFYIDQATRDESGTPNIPETILKKINEANIIVSDISIINKGSTKRKTPNPNVLYELGYASEVIGWPNIICVFNTFYGKFEDLPFDIRFRRPLNFKLEPKQSDKKRIKRRLIDDFKGAITLIDLDDKKLRLKEIINKITSDKWIATSQPYSIENIPKENIQGKATISHFNKNIFDFKFISYQNGLRYERGDWNGKLFLNLDFLFSGKIIFESNIGDVGLKEIFIKEENGFIFIYMLGINFLNQRYGKEILNKKI